MASALFDINSDGGDQGFQGANAQVLTLRLRQQPPIGVNTVIFQVFDPAGFDATLTIAANPPRASKNASTLSIVGATTGQAVSPASVDGTVTITLPATGSHSWIVRCVVNGGSRTLPNGIQVTDPTLIHERGIWIPTVLGARRVVCTELRQFEDDGWAGALADLPDFVVADHTITYPKLPAAVLAPSVVGALVNGDQAERAIKDYLGPGLGISSSKIVPLPRARRQYYQETFRTGNLATGSIGTLGWNLLGVGTPAYARLNNSLVASPASLITSGALNDRATLCWGETESRDVIAFNQFERLECIWRFDAKLTNKRVFCGVIDTFANMAAPVDAIGWYFDSTIGGNYLIWVRRASVGVVINTGVAAPSDTSQMLSIHRPAAGTYNFYLDDVLVHTATTGLPTTDLGNVGVSVQTLAAATTQQNLGYFGLDSTLLAGAFDNDTYHDAW